MIGVSSRDFYDKVILDRQCLLCYLYIYMVNIHKCTRLNDKIYNFNVHYVTYIHKPYIYSF